MGRNNRALVGLQLVSCLSRWAGFGPRASIRPGAPARLSASCPILLTAGEGCPAAPPATLQLPSPSSAWELCKDCRDLHFPWAQQSLFMGKAKYGGPGIDNNHVPGCFWAGEEEWSWLSGKTNSPTLLGHSMPCLADCKGVDVFTHLDNFFLSGMDCMSSSC